MVAVKDAAPEFVGKIETVAFMQRGIEHDRHGSCRGAGGESADGDVVLVDRFGDAHVHQLFGAHENVQRRAGGRAGTRIGGRRRRKVGRDLGKFFAARFRKV